MMHDCDDWHDGECSLCERLIADAEYERDYPADDYDDFYEG
jgi:hypothetical protein